jgi:hypothetical protein
LVALFFLVIAIILFRALKISKARNWRHSLAICGIISFGSRSECALTPAEIIQPKTIRRLSPMLAQTSAEAGAHSLREIFPIRRQRLAVVARPVVPKAQHKTLTSFYICFQTRRSWKSFSHHRLIPASAAGAWMPLRHPSTAATRLSLCYRQRRCVSSSTRVFSSYKV